MKRINVLSKEIFNKISAGEVVEKPASVVKELVENSLDANASEILIEIENGGIDLVRIVDNGSGIHPDDVKSAFLPHATSKISSVDDLSNISSLGFRGEALSSIASVSKFKMQTKQQDFSFGKEIEIDGGIIKNFSEASLNNGTICEVSELFYNIPARKKFLRKPKTEENEITNLVIRYILSNPKVKFTYIVDKNLIYKTNGTNLEDCIYIIYKKDVLNNLIKVDHTFSDFKISGYISKPTFSKSNRTSQSLFINNRYVINSMISSCVQNAYGNMLMKGQFPIYILNITIPFDSLDVNVHPTKLDVKFENTQKIYGYVWTSITKALNEVNSIKQINLFDDEASLENKPNFVNSENLNNDSTSTKNRENFGGKSFGTINERYNEIFKEKERKIFEDYENLAKDAKSFNDGGIFSEIIEKRLETAKIQAQEEAIEEVNVVSKNYGENSKIIEENSEKTYNYEESSSTKQQIFDNISALNYKILGTCFKTYILVEMDNSLLVFDQHACHERLNFDKLVHNMEEKNLVIQPLIVPYIFSVNELEANFLDENIQTFVSLGFEISLFGENCYKISSIPQILSNLNLKNFVDDVLKDLSSLKKLSNIDILKEKLSQKACKASVRAGDSLSEDEIVCLLKLMKENDMTLACPHGRPAVIEITKNELEKWFKRKV